MAVSGKKILLGITGGIAAYKICDLIRQLVKAGAEVKAVLTPNALNFVTETTLRTLTKNPVYIEQFNVADWKPEHISLTEEADLFVIAPATANTIGKIAGGICDNLLTSLVAAFNKPVILAPAMNCHMWENKFVQENICKLERAGFQIIPPEAGELACGYEGTGRLAGIDIIYQKICEVLDNENFLKEKKVLITAGGTKEPIDPVRYITNKSSGKMGIAIADAAYSFGAEVCLISTVSVNKPYGVVSVNTAAEMHEAVKENFLKSDILVMAAAVADYRVKNICENKIKKDSSEEISLKLVKSPDILRDVSGMKKDSQIVIGFCAETENLKENAIKKIDSKNLDFIVANDVSQKETGFDSDYNAVAVFNREHNCIAETSRLKKTEIAEFILNVILREPCDRRIPSLKGV